MVQRGILKPKPRPRFVEPMECKRVSKLPEGKDWVYEIKQDGYRAIGLVDGSSAMLYSMSGQNYTSDFPHIAFALKNLRRGNLRPGRRNCRARCPRTRKFPGTAEPANKPPAHRLLCFRCTPLQWTRHARPHVART